MSKINAVRLININYNNNAIRISDECFHLNGESTLLSLRNGGGKSVLVQMLTAPFVHKRYRDAKDRPFESYFTTNKPSFILVEWALDGGAGYVLTGMMVRRSQETGDGNGRIWRWSTSSVNTGSPAFRISITFLWWRRGRRRLSLKFCRVQADV